MLIRSAIEEYLASKQNSITAKTYDWYEEFLDLFLTWTDSHRLTRLEEVGPTQVAQFVADCAPNASPHTRHACAQVVKGFLKWCSLDDELGVRAKTVSRIEMPKLVQSDVELFTPDDVSRLLRACDRVPLPHRSRAIVHLLLDTGIRASECCYDSEHTNEETGLRMDNVFLGRGGGESYVWVMGKGLKPRTVGVGHETCLALHRYFNRERNGSPDGFVFLSRHGNPLSVRMLQQFLSDLGDLAGVPNTHAHRFRHTFAVNQLLAGTSDLVLMRLMGHSSLESTKIYTRAMSQVQARKLGVSVVDRMKGEKRR
jgi:site-specific recombinase XerD